MTMRLQANEKGVAMVTVLLIGAALTALSSAAAFVTIEELGATRADRNAAQALAYAEAGIDRLVLEIRKGNLTWNDISKAGCDSHPVITYSGTIGTGTYTTTLEVYNRTRTAATPAERFRPAACDHASVDPRAVPHEYLITSIGQQPAAARRVVRQTIDIKPLGLPIGIYAYDRVDANGTVNMQNINMMTEGVVYNRDNLGFFGTDPYYSLGDFYGSTRITDATIRAYKMPASVHAKGAIYYGAASKFAEHRTNFEPNCEANSKGTPGQSLWDTSGSAVLLALSGGCTSWPGSRQDHPDPSMPISTPNSVTPPMSCPEQLPCLKFTEEDRKRVAPSPTLTEQDYLTLREAAKENGLYCTGSGLLTLTISCTEANRLESPNPYPLVGGQLGLTDINDITENSFVVYIEFANDGFDPFLREVKWSGNAVIGPCNTNPATNKSAVIVVRRGSLEATGTTPGAGSTINGAMFIPEGALYTKGNFTMEGTVIARRIESRGTSTLRLSNCWLRNMPGPFLDTTKVTWSEVDR